MGEGAERRWSPSWLPLGPCVCDRSATSVPRRQSLKSHKLQVLVVKTAGKYQNGECGLVSH